MKIVSYFFDYTGLLTFIFSIVSSVEPTIYEAIFNSEVYLFITGILSFVWLLLKVLNEYETFYDKFFKNGNK